MPCCKIGLEFGKCALHNNIKFRARKAYWYITYMNGGLQEHGIWELDLDQGTWNMWDLYLHHNKTYKGEREREKREINREIVLIIFRVSFIFLRDELQGKIKWQIGLWKKKKNIWEICTNENHELAKPILPHFFWIDKVQSILPMLLGHVANVVAMRMCVVIG